MKFSGRHELRNIGVALIGIWLAIVLYSFLYHLSGLLTIHGFEFRPWQQIRGTTLYLWTPWVLLAPVVWYLAYVVPIRPGSGSVIYLVHLAMMTILAIFHGYASALLYFQIGDMDAGMQDYAAWQHTGHFLFLDDMFLMDCFVYFVLMASVTVRRYYELARQKELDAAHSQTQLVESRLQTLRMQVSPHFLFNTLSSISVLIRRNDTESAELMLQRLSTFFRLTLEQGREQIVAVRDELQLIEQYLAIEKTRFADRLDVQFDVDPSCLDERVPVLLLQPLVENAIRHGVEKKPGRCCLRVTIKRDEAGFRICISDDGAGVTADLERLPAGVGLTNVRSRLAALYAGKAEFSFVGGPGTGATVNILLPSRGRAVAFE